MHITKQEFWYNNIYDYFFEKHQEIFYEAGENYRYLND